jgi:hypothetical protein
LPETITPSATFKPLEATFSANKTQNAISEFTHEAQLTQNASLALTQIASYTKTPTNTLTETSIHPTDLPEHQYTRKCLDIFPVLPPEHGFEGILVFDSKDGSGETMNLATGEKRLLNESENEYLDNFVVSPNREFLAFNKGVLDSEGENLVEDWLVIEDAYGKQQNYLPYNSYSLYYPEDGDWRSFYWLNNQQLIIRQFVDLGMDSMLVLDPFTGTQQELVEEGRIDWIDITAGTGVLWDALKIYNSDLTWIVYPGYTFDDSKPSIILFDLQTNQIIANYRNFFYSSLERPRWSPDNKEAAFVLSNYPSPWKHEIAIIKLDGQVNQLTFLSEIFEQVNILRFNWSPDGQKIAFWLMDTSANLPPHELAIVNINTREVTNYCISGVGSNPPIWSPDGHQLLVASRNPIPDDYSPRVVLIDLVRGYAYQIAEGVVPAGWMVSPP